MSCYGWERGEVQLPAAEFSRFKKDLISRLSARQETLLEKANSLHARIKSDKIKDVHEFLERQFKYEKFSSLEQDQIIKSLLKDKKVVKPKKVNFKLDKENLRFEDSDLTVYLKKETKTVVYSSDDNNHSIDDARESYLGRTVLNMLERVAYTNRTGGYLRKQNEYDVDAGVGASVTYTFGKYKNPKYRREIY